MCIFSTRTNVSSTSIFARRDSERQCIVYQMKASAETDTAMILPIPIALAADAPKLVEFVDLSGCPTFFKQLSNAWPPPRRGRSARRMRGKLSLPVEQVGAFDASFVPSIDHFSLIDERFQLPEQTWTDLPIDYGDHGFVVFQFRAGEIRPHPMAFWFHTALDSGDLWFPTVHVHDGDGASFEEYVRFDHALYAQHQAVGDWWEEASTPVAVDGDKGLIASGAPLYRLKMQGLCRNEDTLVV